MCHWRINFAILGQNIWQTFLWGQNIEEPTYHVLPMLGSQIPFCLPVHSLNSILSANEASADFCPVASSFIFKANSSWSFLIVHNVWSSIMVLTELFMSHCHEKPDFNKTAPFVIFCRSFKFVKTICTMYMGNHCLFLAIYYLLNFESIYRKLNKAYFCN